MYQKSWECLKSSGNFKQHAFQVTIAIIIHLSLSQIDTSNINHIFETSSERPVTLEEIKEK